MDDENTGSQSQLEEPRHQYQEPQTTTRRLYRSRQQKMVAGVAGGLGQYFNIDPTLVRLAFVLVALIPGLGGVSLLGYIILAIVVPQYPEGDAEPLVPSTNLDSDRGRQIVGIGLVGIGLLALSGALGLFDLFNWRYFWPLLLIGLGAILLLRRSN